MNAITLNRPETEPYETVPSPLLGQDEDNLALENDVGSEMFLISGPLLVLLPICSITQYRLVATGCANDWRGTIM